MNRSIFLIYFFACSLQAQTWVSQSGSGNNSGSDTDNQMPIANYNSSGSGSVNLVGTLTTPLTATSGTIYFEPNAKFSAPTWTDRVIILQSGCTIDGGQNGLIEATDNGTGLTYSNNLNAVYGNNVSNVLVKNLLIQNLYKYVGPNDEQPFNSGGGSGIIIEGTWSNIVISNCVCHDMMIGFGWNYAANCANSRLTHCTAYNCNWGGNCADTGSASTIHDFTVDHCHFYDWQNWDDNNDYMHHNGFYFWAMSSGQATNVMFNANYVGPGYGSHNTAGLFVSGEQIFNLIACNNIFDASDGTSPANAQLMIMTYTPTTTNMVFNNTFTGNNASALEIEGKTNGVSSCPTFINNNEFLNCKFAISFFYGITSFQYLRSNTNNFYGNPQFTTAWDGTGGGGTYLAQWQAYDNPDYHLDPNSTTSNPLLNGSYIPQTGSSLIGAGMNLSQYFTTDYAGNPRPATGAWTIGAYEYQAPPPSAATPHSMNWLLW